MPGITSRNKNIILFREVIPTLSKTAGGRNRSLNPLHRR